MTRPVLIALVLIGSLIAAVLSATGASWRETVGMLMAMAFLALVLWAMAGPGGVR